jgi:hypothetical protein
VAFVDHLGSNDQVVLGVRRHLHVVAHHARAAPAGGHRARIGVGLRELLVGLLAQLGLDIPQVLHLLAQLDQLVLQPRGPGLQIHWLRAVCGVQCVQVSMSTDLAGPTPAIDRVA